MGLQINKTPKDKQTNFLLSFGTRNPTKVQNHTQKN